MGDARTGNMVMLGAMLGRGIAVSEEAVHAALAQVVKSRPELLELNKKAIRAGMEAVRS